jgi:hypothetical protein
MSRLTDSKSDWYDENYANTLIAIITLTIQAIISFVVHECLLMMHLKKFFQGIIRESMFFEQVSDFLKYSV